MRVRPRTRQRSETSSARQRTQRSQSLLRLLERLVDAEVRDLKAEWVHANELIRHVASNDEIQLRHVRLVATFRPCSRRVQQLLKRHGCLVRRVPNLGQAGVLNGNVPLVLRRVCEEGFKSMCLVVLRDCRVRQCRLEEEQRVGIFALNSRPDATEVLYDKLRQEVPQFGRLRLVSGRVVLHCLGAADVINAHDQRLHIRVGPHRPEVQSDQSECNQGEENDRDLEIGVHHKRGAVQLHELPLRTVQCLRVDVRNRWIHGLPQHAHCEELPQDPNHPRPEAHHQRHTEHDEEQPRQARRGYVLPKPSVIVNSAGHLSAFQPLRNRLPGFRVRGKMLSPAVPEKIELVSDGTRTIPTQKVITTATAWRPYTPNSAVVIVGGNVVTYRKTNLSKIIRNAIATTGMNEYWMKDLSQPQNSQSSFGTMKNGTKIGPSRPHTALAMRPKAITARDSAFATAMRTSTVQ